MGQSWKNLVALEIMYKENSGSLPLFMAFAFRVYFKIFFFFFFRNQFLTVNYVLLFILYIESPDFQWLLFSFIASFPASNFLTLIA